MTDELSTLKAQLASSESIRKAEKKILIDEIRLRSQSEQRERELRELMLRVNPFVESALERESQAPANHQLFQQQARMLMSKWQAALRSAPPSTTVEVEDSARQGSDAGEAGVAGDVGSPSSLPASEQFPAASDGFTHNRAVISEDAGTATADKSVDYSGPQDSPSRSQCVPCCLGFRHSCDVHDFLDGYQLPQTIQQWLDFAYAYAYANRSEPAPPSRASEKDFHHVHAVSVESPLNCVECGTSVLRGDRRVSGVRERRWTGGWQKENKSSHVFIGRRTGPLDRRERK